MTLIIALYGLFIAIGGIIGYLKARSQISLIAGLGNAIVLWIAAYVTLNNLDGGLILAVCIAVELLVFFSLRWSKTRKFMPAGLMAILSLIATVGFLWVLLAR
ncbi:MULTISPECIES: TMEM14 family protein [Leptolyngbya]|uniref:TMEM14 family protein n=1 Tax=Leptolyngbya TaxID=47251 RepID=UPI0018F0173A